MDEPRIVFVTPGPLRAEAGASQILINLSGAISRKELAVEIVELRSTRRRRPWWAELGLDRREVETRCRACGPGDVIDAPAQYLNRRLGNGALLVARSVQPELAYLASGRTGPASRSRGWMRRLVERLVELRLEKAIRQGWAQADRILALGRMDAQATVESAPAVSSKVAVYCAAPSDEERRQLERIRSGSRRAAVRAAEARFLWIGRWAEHKGVRTLASFVERFLRQYPAASLTIAGTKRPDLEISRDLIASGRIRVVPSFNRSELLDLLRDHDAGLFTSIVEGWGLVLQEMLEAGLVVYATRAGAVPDLVDWFPERLREFPPDPDDSVSLPASRLLPKGYLERFNWDEIATSYLREVLREGRAE